MSFCRLALVMRRTVSHPSATGCSKISNLLPASLLFSSTRRLSCCLQRLARRQPFLFRLGDRSDDIGARLR